MSGMYIPFYKSLSGRLLLALTFIALVSVIGLGLAAYLDERNALEAQVKDQLTSVADLKKEQIITWLAERQADARLLAVNKLNQDHLTQILSPDTSPEVRKAISDFLTDNLIGMQQSRAGYIEVTFVDKNGTVIITTNPDAMGKPTVHRVAFEGTMTSPTSEFIEDMHYDPHTGLTSMAFGHEMKAIDLATGEELPEAVGSVIIVVNMEETIYPLIQAWSGMRETGETLLVRSEGNDTVYLSNLRFDDDAALNLRIPNTSSIGQAGYLAATGQEDITQTTDYRDALVLAAYRYIPATGWGFVAKEDLDEAFAPVTALTIVGPFVKTTNLKI